jgi:hypothetical protein
MYNNPVRNIKLSNGSPATGSKNPSTTQKPSYLGVGNNNQDKLTSKIGFNSNQGAPSQTRQNYCKIDKVI